MANVVRLVNGGGIQVRSGVIQGIGPIGPRGYVGNQGPQGEQGPIGPEGPMGQILENMGSTKVATSNPVAANTDTTISFGSAVDDVPGFFPTLTNCLLSSPGGYLLSVWLRFDDAAASGREVWFQVGAQTIARTSRMAGVGAPFYVDLTFPYKAVGGEVVNVVARSGATTAISDGSWTCTRVGSGPPGPIGPPGIQGVQGIQGIQGIKGDDGDANSGFATYAEMLPH